MTREEAIKIFKDWIKEGFPYDGGYAVEELEVDEKKACKMAIKALKEEHCEEEHCVDIINTLGFGIQSTNGNDSYSVGMRNGIKWALSVITNETPHFDSVEQTPTSPCDVCRHNPPSSICVGKPCCMCPAEGRTEDDERRSNKLH